jgi:hypothetical protein
MPVEPKFKTLLATVVQHQADFFVVGGIAAILHGSPVMTEDLDIVFDPSPENIQRLLAALQELEARYNDPAGQHFVPDADKLGTLRLNLLLTNQGRLDVLREIGQGQGYGDLVGRTVEMDLGEFTVRVLDLPTLIEMKEIAGREKDRHGLLYLRELHDRLEAE